jgi:hypothetical protein
MGDSYADWVRTMIAHAPVRPIRSQGARMVDQQMRNDAVEPESVAVFTNAG